LLLQVVTLPTRRDRWVGIVAVFVYNAVVIGAWSRTLGQRVVRVHVAMLDGAERATVVAAVVRAGVVAAGAIALFGGRAIGGPVGVTIGTIGAVFGLAVYIPIFGEERRGLHDRASGTVVLLDPAS